jgi:hypothetical protein
METPIEITSIAKYTGLRETAIKTFIKDNNLNAKEILNHVAKEGIENKIELITAMAGETNTTEQKKIIKSFQTKPPQDGD